MQHCPPGCNMLQRLAVRTRGPQTCISSCPKSEEVRVYIEVCVRDTHVKPFLTGSILPLELNTATDFDIHTNFLTI